MVRARKCHSPGLTSARASHTGVEVDPASQFTETRMGTFENSDQAQHFALGGLFAGSGGTLMFPDGAP